MLSLGMLEFLSPEVVAPVLIERQREQLEKDDLTPGEREWMDLALKCESYESLWYETLERCGLQRSVEIMSEIARDEANDINYYSYLIDEDPEYIAAPTAPSKTRNRPAKISRAALFIATQTRCLGESKLA